MRIKKIKKYKQKAILHLLGILAIYTLGGWGISVFCGIYWKSIPFNLVEWVYPRRDIVQSIYLIVGYTSIFLYFWRKTWSYLEEIDSALESLYQNSDEAIIKLSDSLNDIEYKMNKVKATISSADKAIKIAESKKSDLMAYLAHDLRTPLTSIIGFLIMIQETPDMLKEKREYYIQRLIEKSEYLEQLVNEFFEITQYNTGQLQICKEKIDLYYMLIQLTDEFVPLLSERGNTVTLDIDEKMRADLDPDKMSRVFENLLRNAIFYSYENTEIIVSAYKKNDFIYINFQNEGDTLTEKQQAIIFQKFGRLDSSKNSYAKGTGLGLSIAQEIVQLHGGKLEVESYNQNIIFKIIIACS